MKFNEGLPEVYLCGKFQRFFKHFFYFLVVTLYTVQDGILVQPRDFTKISTQWGHDFWKLESPDPKYKCLGTAVTVSGERPSPMRYCCIHENHTSKKHQVSKAASDWVLPSNDVVKVIERHDDDFTTINSGHFILAGNSQEERLIVSDGVTIKEDYTMNFEPSRSRLITFRINSVSNFVFDLFKVSSWIQKRLKRGLKREFNC